MSSSANEITVAARGSLLSRAQVKEVEQLVQKQFPETRFIPSWISTTGDLDQRTSLLTLEKTDFFTKQVDEAVISGACRIAIHSAKDLPEVLLEGLSLIAYTKGVDPSDVLVFRNGQGLLSLPNNPKIGTSSLRRKENLKSFLPDCVITDIRGPVDKRLQLLDEGNVDAVVMALAALIRLGIRREYIVLPGEVAPLQGKLAVIAKKDDNEMRQLFCPFHTAI